ncbi:MAG TPA: Bcr/CflA family multidrug efflux MFS transporter [Stellaceae bacterium]|nr:Bcr/CflA family multidrug efflux MFS transporter [Stellaceae bacterium]
MIRSDSRALVVLLGAMTALTALAIDMSLPALPALSAAFDASPERVQLTLSLFITGYAVGQIFHGPLSDRFGRKPVLIGGLLIYVAAAIACAVSQSIGVLIAARLVMGFGGCVGPVLARAVVRDHYGGSHAAQMYSSLTAVFALAPLVAPLVGGWLLVHFGWRAIFVVLALFAGTLLAVIGFAFAESLTAPDRDALRLGRLARNYGAFLTSRMCLGYALVNGLCWAGIFAFLSGSPFVFITIYGIAPEHYGFYFALSAVALVIGALSNKQLLRRQSHARVLCLGLSVTIIGGVIVLAACITRWGGAGGVMAGFMLYIWGQAVVAPNAMAAALEPVPHMAGTGAALMGVIQMASGAAAGYAVNALYDGTPVPMGAVILAMALATAGLYFAMLRRPATT